MHYVLATNPNYAKGLLYAATLTCVYTTYKCNDLYKSYCKDTTPLHQKIQL